LRIVFGEDKGHGFQPTRWPTPLPQPVSLMNFQPPRDFGYIQSDHIRMAYHSVVSQLGRHNGM
jgi:hypothetical protein